MSVQSEITRIESAKTAIAAAIEGKGVTVPDATLLDGMAPLIESIEAGGGADISPWSDMVTFSITPAEDLTGDIDFTLFVPDITSFPSAFILGQRAKTSDSSYVQSIFRMDLWNTWRRLYYQENKSTSAYPIFNEKDGVLKVGIGIYKLEAGVPYWGAMLWR